MTDARIVATNPADSSVVPVACNENGELLLAEGTTDQFVEKAGDTMTGNLHVGDNIVLEPDGTGKFADIYVGPNATLDDNPMLTVGNNLRRGSILVNGPWPDSGATMFMGKNDESGLTILMNHDGKAFFKGDVIIGSRNKQWMIIESGGIAHLVQQTRKADISDQQINYPKLRDIPQELTMVEQALGEVMEKLRMTPPAGWEVWDGSSEN